MNPAIYSAAISSNQGCNWKWKCIEKAEEVFCECLHEEMPIWFQWFLGIALFLIVLYVIWRLIRK